MKQLFKIILFLLLTLSNSHLYAQLKGRPKIDSLLKELYKAKEDTNKCNILFSLAIIYNGITPDTSIQYGQQDSALATRLGWRLGLARANNVLGANYNNKSDYPRALEYFNETLKIYEEIDDKTGMALVIMNFGNIYQTQGDYPKALGYHFKALKIFEETGEKRGISKATNNIGLVYESQGDYPKSLEYFFKALKLDEEIKNKEGILMEIGNIGSVYTKQKLYQKALDYNSKALTLAEEIGNKAAIKSIIGNIGNIYNDQKNYIMALEYMQKALKMSEALGNKRSMAINLVNIGEVYINLTKYTTAKTERVNVVPEFSISKYQPTVSIPKSRATLLMGAFDCTQRALGIGKEIKSLTVIQYCYKNLSEAYKLNKDYKKALEYSDSARITNDSIFSKENSEKITRLENKRKEFADSLKAADAKRSADIKAAHRRNYELIGAAAFVLLLGFTFLLRKNIKLLGKEKKRSDNLLLNILPEEVATQLKDTGSAAARNFDNVTVLFTDFVNFTEATGRMKPETLIQELDTCFKKFDAITSKYNIEKIKTIGDAYLAVCGLPHPDPKHAENIVKAALEIAAFMQDREAKLGNNTFGIRLGINTGPVIAGIVGDKKFAYDIWGDTVNTAARMEQNSSPGRINISQSTYELVKDQFNCEYRGEIDVKGKGVMRMYFIG